LGEKNIKSLLRDVFFKKFHSWERGSNENINGLIRQYIPKKSHILALPDEYITFVENEINNRPRKRFGFRTPNEIFLSFSNSGGVAFTS
jgi:IS30 family transposase